MFTFEIRINGALIGHIYGHNEDRITPQGEDTYRYEYYETESRRIANGGGTHKRSEGIRKLVAKILTDSEKP